MVRQTVKLKGNGLVINEKTLKQAGIEKEATVLIGRGEIRFVPFKKSDLWEIVGLLKLGGDAVNDSDEAFEKVQNGGE